jgi:DNA-binding LacI/PurR family transcriptional regulator
LYAQSYNAPSFFYVMKEKVSLQRERNTRHAKRPAALCVAETRREGVRTVTQRQIAKEVGVTQQLVALALQNSPRVVADTCRGIWDTAQRLGYDRHANRHSHGLAAERHGRKLDSDILAVVLDVESIHFDAAAMGRRAVALVCEMNRNDHTTGKLKMQTFPVSLTKHASTPPPQTLSKVPENDWTPS